MSTLNDAYDNITKYLENPKIIDPRLVQRQPIDYKAIVRHLLYYRADHPDEITESPLEIYAYFKTMLDINILKYFNSIGETSNYVSIDPSAMSGDVFAFFDNDRGDNLEIDDDVEIEIPRNIKEVNKIVFPNNVKVSGSSLKMIFPSDYNGEISDDFIRYFPAAFNVLELPDTYKKFPNVSFIPIRNTENESNFKLIIKRDEANKHQIVAFDKNCFEQIVQWKN